MSGDDSELTELTVVDRTADLATMRTMTADLVAEYWSPEDGEARRAVYWGIEEQMVPDFNDPNKHVPLKCVILGFQSGGRWRRVCNGSKRLVAVFESNDVPLNTAYEITFHGVEKNKTNNNKSGRWSVVPLVKTVAADG